MKVETYLFGTVEVNPDSVIQFPGGLVGFEDQKRFMLAYEEDKGTPNSFTLQSLDNPSVAFQIIDPTSLGFNYELVLSDAENASLQTPASADVAVMLIVFKQEEGQPMGANFRAPLIINTKAKVGIQKVIEHINSNITISNLSNPV